MGEVSETMTKRKKKGRPSLLDLQKRTLKKQQQHQQQQLQLQNPKLINSHSDLNRRPTRRNSVLGLRHATEEGIADDDDDDERKEKKHKLLVGLNSHHHYSALSPVSPEPYGTNWNEDGHDPEDPRKRRRINVTYQGSDETSEKVPKATDSKHGSQGESGPTTPLPDKKLLVFILDRLQKKDTHGVFSEPVDPEELPDYHDIIEHPMDFATKDVFLICSNAMQYNAPDTIYHRQARAMQELARKDFANLRQDSDDSEPQPKIVRRGRPPGKNSRKSLGMSPSECVAPDSSSDVTLASGGDNGSGGPNSYNLRKGTGKFQPADSLARTSHNTLNSTGYTNWLSEWENEFPASVLKAVLRYGKKQFMVDETRRETYKHLVATEDEPPVLATIEEEFKKLIAVGLTVKHSYTRSLAHFAADLGPVVWKIAARKISSVLPGGQEFGPGWVGEDEVSQSQQFAIYDQDRSLDAFVPDNRSSRFLPPSGSFSGGYKSCLQSGDVKSIRGLNFQNELNSVNSVDSGIEYVVPSWIKQDSVVRSDDVIGSNDRLGPNFSPQMRMVNLSDLTGLPSSGDGSRMIDKGITGNFAACLMPSEMSSPAKTQISNDFGQSDSSNMLAEESGSDFQKGLAVKPLIIPVKHNSLSIADDLNRKIGATNASSSSVDTGSHLQPNLALQL
ncbi:uncharacterized protein LOC114727029 isoform X2 [Neltuma alba]|uniref:uncharacterized protein LOC114723100 isoform X2 n=1 Tax=Neltuma alba TaxID=207710 RepID=UPI0010A43E02|nr:uncharacterized protein LOC114723100 isoform X2 [Prosopis alba]XP_028769577.1 uncharacterized protein LOC114727029 isoform X2 [Prosopis alba]